MQDIIVIKNQHSASPLARVYPPHRPGTWAWDMGLGHGTWAWDRHGPAWDMVGELVSLGSWRDRSFPLHYIEDSPVESRRYATYPDVCN